ncbi:MAG: hypothetical protein Q8L36_03185 [bacterium]|nr:hypothetical protein [bacterium]
MVGRTNFPTPYDLFFKLYGGIKAEQKRLHSRRELEQWLECWGVHAELELGHWQYEQQRWVSVRPVFIDKQILLGPNKIFTDTLSAPK